MSWLSNLFGGGGSGGANGNPMNSANPYLNQIPGVAHQGYDDYINQGKDASGKTKGAYEGMMNDPTGFINHIMENYKTSEGYGFAKDKLTKEMGNTAAMGGVAGTPMDQMNQAEGVQGLLSKDMQQFLQNALGRYDKGLEGEEGIAGRGYSASGNLTDALGNALNQQGGLAFQDTQSRNAQNSADKKGLWDMFGKALGAGAGFAFGGPAGAGVGYKLGGGAGNLFGGK
jgi:hypothetical protein